MDGGNNSRSMSPPLHCSTLSNILSHDDGKDTEMLDGNLEQQEAQEETSSNEASLFSWSTILANDSDVWEPYALNPPPPTSDDNERRLEALQAFFDLAIHRDTTSRHEPTVEEANFKVEEPTKSVDKDTQDMNTSPIESAAVTTTTDQELQSIQQQQRETIANFLDVECSKLPRIRDYQEQQWEKHYMHLVEFHQREGHCCVPNKSQEHAGLARWVKRQRYQYKLRQKEVTKSTMVPHRMKALERLGFVWDAHAALWEEQFYNLRAFCILYGHCGVPSVFPANPQLSTWVKRQRRLYRENSMPQSRQEKLNEIGFDWMTR